MVLFFFFLLYFTFYASRVACFMSNGSSYTELKNDSDNPYIIKSTEKNKPHITKYFFLVTIHFRASVWLPNFFVYRVCAV